MPKLSGSCLCGSVHYELEGDPVAFYHCHCKRCRKANGTGHASNIRISAEAIKWLSGEELIKSFKVPDAVRFRNDFCSACGSPLPRFFAEAKMVVLPAGTLDSEAPIRPEARIFYASRTEWSCKDDLPVHEEYPPNL